MNSLTTIKILFIMLTIQTQDIVGKKFPTISATTLSGDQIIFPDELDKDANIVILAFEEWAQKDVDTWAGFILKHYNIDEEINYYELPMMSKFYSWLSGWIDGGMKNGIDVDLHDNVATFYGERKSYFETLGVEDLNTCYIYLIDKNGKIIFAAEGALNEKNCNEMQQKIQLLQAK
jgi:hypothetical protein